MLDGTLHVIDTFTKRKSVTKQRDKACKQDINRILLLDSDSLGFESFGFGILNCPSLITAVQKHKITTYRSCFVVCGVEKTALGRTRSRRAKAVMGRPHFTFSSPNITINHSFQTRVSQRGFHRQSGFTTRFYMLGMIDLSKCKINETHGVA